MSEDQTALQAEAPEIDAEPQQMDESGAHKALKAEREARKRLERELASVKSQLSPEAARQLEDRIKAAEEAQKKAEEDAAKKEQQSRLKYEATLREQAQELERERAQFTQYKLRMEGMKIFQAAEGRDGVSGDGRSFFDFLWSAKGSEFAYDSDGKLMIVDADGQPLMDKESGTRVNPVDYVKGLQTDPVYGHLFKSAFGSGSGGRSVMGGRTIPGQDLHSLPKSEKFRVAFSSGK